MIAYLHGKLAESTPTNVVVDCQGVGYAVFIPLSSYDKLPARGGEVKLLTYHHVVAHEGTQQLFGFVTPDEREMFVLLISISGIGPKLAINILSSTSISALRSAIASGDTKTLSALRGIGKKTAERLVVELKDKIGGATAFEAKGRAATPEEQKLTDAVLALVSLGYKQMDAHKSVLAAAEKAGPKATVEEIVRTVLRAA
ncbi:MAG TPA: Holliday junction branch migration protein RuvA [Verrucomicrobiae bacterium]|nr:Holliday junction branch migration protein RuvA [Verrucomicrobiae bacterium]